LNAVVRDAPVEDARTVDEAVPVCERLATL